MRRKIITICSIVALFLIVTIILTSMNSVFDVNDRDNSIVVTTNDIQETIVIGLVGFDFPKKESYNVIVNNIKQYDKQWLIITATLIDEPITSEARHMVYILKKSDDERIKLVSFSGDGFDEANSPEGIPSGVIQEANK